MCREYVTDVESEEYCGLDAVGCDSPFVEGRVMRVWFQMEATSKANRGALLNAFERPHHLSFQSACFEDVSEAGKAQNIAENKFPLRPELHLQ